MKLIIVGAMLFALCAYSSTDGSSNSTTEPTVGAATQPADNEPATNEPEAGEPATAEATEPGGSVASAAVSKELCAFLKQEVPRLKARGSSVGALAGFAVDYAGWVEKDADHRLTNAAELDAVTSSACPKVRAAILEVLETTSFTTVLGG